MVSHAKLLFWVALLAALLTATPAFAVTESEGSVVCAAEHRLVLSEDSTQRVFAVSKYTTITLDGEEAVLEDILPGFVARVMAEQQGDTWDAPWIAVTVDAYTNK
jgi:hypothetical protein